MPNFSEFLENSVIIDVMFLMSHCSLTLPMTSLTPFIDSIIYDVICTVDNIWLMPYSYALIWYIELICCLVRTRFFAIIFAGPC